MLGQAVYDRRTALGLSQTELARRSDMTQPRISTIEGGDATLPLLTRLAKALDAALTIRLDDDASRPTANPTPANRPKDKPPQREQPLTRRDRSRIDM